MFDSFRRYELFLHSRLMNQQRIPDELIFEILLEVKQRLGIVSSENQRVRCFWRHEGQSYRDDLERVFVDVPDTAENRRFFEEHKERLKTRFRQVDIWMTTYLIEVL